MKWKKIYIERIGNEPIPSYETVLMKTYKPSILIQSAELNHTLTAREFQLTLCLYYNSGNLHKNLFQYYLSVL